MSFDSIATPSLSYHLLCTSPSQILASQRCNPSTFKSLNDVYALYLLSLRHPHSEPNHSPSLFPPPALQYLAWNSNSTALAASADSLQSVLIWGVTKVEEEIPDNEGMEGEGEKEGVGSGRDAAAHGPDPEQVAAADAARAAAVNDDEINGSFSYEGMDRDGRARQIFEDEATVWRLLTLNFDELCAAETSRAGERRRRMVDVRFGEGHTSEHLLTIIVNLFKMAMAARGYRFDTLSVGLRRVIVRDVRETLEEGRRYIRDYSLHLSRWV